jgi:hypothetical protein
VSIGGSVDLIFTVRTFNIVLGRVDPNRHSQHSRLGALLVEGLGELRGLPLCNLQVLVKHAVRLVALDRSNDVMDQMIDAPRDELLRFAIPILLVRRDESIEASNAARLEASSEMRNSPASVAPAALISSSLGSATMFASRTMAFKKSSKL